MLFSDHVNPQVVKWRQRRAPGWLWGPDMAPGWLWGPDMAPGWLWGPDMAPTVSACLVRPCSGILALCGCMYTS